MVFLYGMESDPFGQLEASTNGTTVTANASANTKGSYSQLIASTAYPSAGIMLEVVVGSNNADYLMDLAIGGAGSEQILIADILVGSTVGSSRRILMLPCAIPAGTRISARCQSTTGGATLTVMGHLFTSDGSPVPSASLFTTYGANSADSGGVGIDPGGVANTPGAYAQLTASSAYPHHALALCVGCQNNATPSAGRWLVDLAVGGAGSEQIILLDFPLSGGGSTSQGGPTPSFVVIPCSIPAGTRIAARARSSITTSPGRLIDLVLIGITYGNN